MSPKPADATPTMKIELKEIPPKFQAPINLSLRDVPPKK